MLEFAMTPRVAICVPNVNSLPFLRERFDTIFAQTLRDWELFVYDSFSDDGAWEFIQRLAPQESRMRIAQGPRDGVYPAWNECVRQTRAEFVYIATSDDTMAPDCLEKLASALDRHQDCDRAHCPLVVVDEGGASIAGMRWPQSKAFEGGSGEMLYRPHVRRAPYDGLLHLTGLNVYLSMTQLLVRRSLISRLGGFESRWGSISDFHWHMRAGLIGSSVHVPDTWASWRVHSKQVTAAVSFSSRAFSQRIEEMIEDAVLASEAALAPSVVAGLRSEWLERTRELRTYQNELQRRPRGLQRRLFQASQVLHGSASVRAQIVDRLLGKPSWRKVEAHKLRVWLESLQLGPVVLPVEASPSTDTARGTQ